MKLLCTIIALCGVVNCFAQLEKGRMFVSGAANFRNSRYDNEAQKTTAFSTTLKGGYMLTDNFALGLSVDYYNYRSEGKILPALTTWNLTKQRRYGASIFARQYLSANDKLHFFIDGEALYQNHYDYYWQENVTRDSTVSNRYGISLTPGVLFFVTKKIAVSTTLGRVSYLFIEQPANKTKFFDFEADFNILSFSFGASIFF